MMHLRAICVLSFKIFNVTLLFNKQNQLEYMSVAILFQEIKFSTGLLKTNGE